MIKSKNKPSENELIKEELGIKLMTAKHPLIKKLKKEYPTSIHGDKFWSSSYLIMDYLNDNPPKEYKNFRNRMRLGLNIDLLFQKKFGCDVTGVDADPDVVPYLNSHAGLNEVYVRSMVSKFEDLDEKFLADYDLIIGGDICFWPKLNNILFKLFKRAKNAGVSKAIIADPQRQPFVDLCARLDDYFDHEVWDWELPEPTPANGDILVVNFDKS